MVQNRGNSKGLRNQPGLFHVTTCPLTCRQLTSMCLENRGLQTLGFAGSGQCVKQSVRKDVREWWGQWQMGDPMSHLR